MRCDMQDCDRAFEIAELCLRARAALGSEGTFKLRVLLDMVLIELGGSYVATETSTLTLARPGTPSESGGQSIRPRSER